MKEIKAYIKSHKLNEITSALHKLEKLSGMSVVNVRGFGRSRGKDAHKRFVEELVDYVPHVKIEIVCLDDMVNQIVSIIKEHAHTGLRGDGKIYISSVD